jgi:hypothetical protein
MADTARLKLDDDIAECTRTVLMLRELHGEALKGTIIGKKAYRNDAAAALDHAMRIVTNHRRNLEDVRGEYDGKVHGSPLGS